MNFESYRTFLVPKTFVIYIFGEKNDWIVVTDVLQYMIGVRVFYHNYLNSITALYLFLYLIFSDLILIARVCLFKLLLNY